MVELMDVASAAIPLSFSRFSPPTVGSSFISAMSFLFSKSCHSLQETVQMSSFGSRTASLMLFAVILTGSVLLAHPVCRSCTKNCFQNTTTVSNGTEVEDLIAELQQQQSRPKRSTDGGEVEYRACSRFQYGSLLEGYGKEKEFPEMLFIPLAIAMIPIVLTALILCTCCCGPKDSRGKLPEDFLSTLPMSKKRRISSEEFELDFRDGYVQRKDSAKTKFSTVVSYIEARRESIWSTRTDPDNLEGTKAPPPMVRDTSKTDRLKPQASTESIKKTRFSDTVSVISVDSLPRRS